MAEEKKANQSNVRQASIQTDGQHVHLDLGQMSPLEVCEACRRILDKLTVGD